MTILSRPLAPLLFRSSALLALFFGSLALGCTSSTKAADRSRQLDQCRVISHDGEELTRCLITLHDWGADTAFQAGIRFQVSLDSIRDSIEKSLDSVRDSMNRARDSIELALANSRRYAREAAAARLDRWATCIFHQDSIAPLGAQVVDLCRRFLPTGKVDLVEYVADRTRLSDLQRNTLFWAYTKTTSPGDQR